jgi:hypothetical protein
MMGHGSQVYKSQIKLTAYMQSTLGAAVVVRLSKP